jgi:hypothetical protein
MRFINGLIKLAIFVILLFGVKSIYDHVKTGSLLPNWFQNKESMATTHHILLQEITTMGKLELVRYNFKDVVEQEKTNLFLPNAKAVLIVQGEAIGCVDLTLVEIADITENEEFLVLNLPEPELCVFKIDHNKSKVYNTEYAFTDESKLIDEAYKHAERQIQQSALDMGILDQTRENARKILTPIFEKSTGRKVVIKFPLNQKIDKLR